MAQLNSLVVTGNSKFINNVNANTIDLSVNSVGINFRPTNGTYYTTTSYQTSGNEALVFASKNAVTSFMFVNGEDSVANHGDARWRSLTPGLQIKQNCVSIGQLIDTNVTPTYRLLVNGTTRINEKLTVGSSAQATLPNAGIHVHDVRNVDATPGFLNSAVNFYFTNRTNPYANSPWYSVMHVNGWSGSESYNAWEIAGPSHTGDQRTIPLYVRTSNGGTWGSWRQIYDSSNKPDGVKDIGNSTNTTFAYSKSGLAYANYTWLAGWNGYELRAINKNQFAQASHTHSVSDLTWVAPANLTCTATANSQEWSIDLKPDSYTGTYWHVWSGPNSKSILACYPDDNSVQVPNGTLTVKNTTYSDYYGSPSSVTTRLTSLNFTGSAAGTGKTKVRFDLVSSSTTTGAPPADTNKNSCGYLHTYMWDNGTNAMSQLYIPNGDHITSSYGPQGLMIRGQDNGTWKDWVKIPFFTAAITTGQVLVSDGTMAGIKSSGYTIAKSVPSNAVFTDANVTQTATSTNALYEVLFSITADNTTRTEGARKSSGMLFNPATGTLRLQSTGGTVEGGQVDLQANASDNTKAGIVLDNYDSTFRIFGIQSADGTTKTGTGTPLVINPYAKTITGGYTLTGSLNGNASTASSATKATQDSDGNAINTTYRKRYLATFSGNGDSAGYCKVCTITITSAYVNGPIEIVLQERGRVTINRLYIMFNSVNNSDPSLNAFKVLGSYTGFYIYKVTTSKWEVYATKNEAWSGMTVVDCSLYALQGPGMTIAWNMENASLPSSGTTQATHLYATSDTNTHRPIQMNDTEILGNNTTALNLKQGSNVTLTNSSGTVTIAATNTLNTAGSTDTSSKIFLIGATSQAANPQTYSDDQVYTTSGTLQTNKTNATAGVNANTGNYGDNGGVSLYSTDPNVYGIAFRTTSNMGTHGYVTSDWATYLTMSNSNNRGWVFRRYSSGNVASIDTNGRAVFNSSVTVGNTTNGGRMEYNSTNHCIDFIVT